MEGAKGEMVSSVHCCWHPVTEFDSKIMGLWEFDPSVNSMHSLPIAFDTYM